jgi:uncharacterized membrane protein
MLCAATRWRGTKAAELIVLGFKDATKADEAVPQLQAIQGEGLIQLADWARVIRREDGKIEVRQAENITGAGAAGGALLGLLLGLLFLMPLAGLVVGGAVGGAIIGHFADYGISDQFIKDVGNQITRGSSALFLYVVEATTDRVIERLQPYGPTVLRTSLSHDAEDRLRAAMEGPASS